MVLFSFLYMILNKFPKNVGHHGWPTKKNLGLLPKMALKQLQKSKNLLSTTECLTLS